jgi:hypothetical protein
MMLEFHSVMLKCYETAHSYEDIIEFPSIFETFQLGHLTSHRVHKLLFSLVTVLQFEIVGKSLFSFVLSLTCDMRKHQFQCSVCDVRFPITIYWWLPFPLGQLLTSLWKLITLWTHWFSFYTLSTIPFISVSVFMYFWMHYFQCTVLSMLCLRNT